MTSTNASTPVDVVSLLDLEREWTSECFEQLAATRDNAFCVRSRRSGSATAYLAAGIPHIGYNRIIGALSGYDELEHLAADYPDPRGFGVDVIPGLASTTFLGELARNGFAAKAFHNTYVGPAAHATMPHPPQVGVRQLQPGDTRLFAEVFTACGAVPPVAGRRATAADLAEAEGRLISRPGWAGPVAEIDGEPAAVARVFFAKGGAAFLTGAFSIPKFRRRGCQAALLRARFRLAAERGVSLMVGQAVPETTSARNLERAGLALRSTKMVVTRH